MYIYTCVYQFNIHIYIYVYYTCIYLALQSHVLDPLLLMYCSGHTHVFKQSIRTHSVHCASLYIYMFKHVHISKT